MWENVIGKEGVGNGNSNGIQLLTKCAEHQLVIRNTLFRQKNVTEIRRRGDILDHATDYVFVHIAVKEKTS